MKRTAFTLVELMVALALLAAVTAVMVSHVNYSSTIETTLGSDLRAAFSDIEMAMNLYKNDKGDYPDEFTVSGFVPKYLFPPRTPNSYESYVPASWTFDSDIVAGDAAGDLYVGHRSGAVDGKNGWFICGKVIASRANEAQYTSLVTLSDKMPLNKFYYGDKCPTTDANSGAPVGNTAYYPTYWITRE